MEITVIIRCSTIHHLDKVCFESKWILEECINSKSQSFGYWVDLDFHSRKLIENMRMGKLTSCYRIKAIVLLQITHVLYATLAI